MCDYLTTDDNVCTMGTNNCHANAECTNTPGSFSCVCVAGYSGDGVICQGIHVTVLIWLHAVYFGMY